MPFPSHVLGADLLRTPRQMEEALGAVGQPIAAGAVWRFGALRRRGEWDKKGYDQVAPLSDEARAALNAYLSAHPTVGEAPLIRATTEPSASAHKMLCLYWLRRAERLANLPRLGQGGYHPFRRQWASERRHLPVQDVMAAGG